MQRRARSNTALFGPGGNGNEADLPTFQDEARAASRFPGAQRNARRPRGVAKPARARTAPPRAVASPGKRFGLDAARRLREKALFERLLREGSRRNRGGYTFFFAQRESGPARLGLLVTRKHAARSTDRNRIKRCIREAFRLEQETLGAVDLLVRPPYGIKPTPEMILQLRHILGSLQA